MPAATVTARELRTIAKRLLSYRKNAVGFVRDILHVEPDEWQQRALRAVSRGESVAIKSGHGVGKSALMSWIMLWFLCTRPWPKIPCTAPTQHQLFDILWSEVSYWLKKSVLKDILVWTGTRVAMIGNEESWFAAARTANKPENLAGFHAKNLLYLIDEGSGVGDDIMQAVDGALTTDGAVCVMAGNPTRREGYFFRAFTSDKASWRRITISSEDSPRVSEEYCAKMARTWGKDSDVYRVRVLGKFPKADTDSFIGYELVQQAIDNYANPEWASLLDDEIQIGLDVARFGDAYTTIYVRRGGRVIHTEAHNGWSTAQTAGKAIKLIKTYNADAIKVDDTGVGGGVTDLLMEASYTGDIPDYCRVVPVNFGGDGDDNYHNTCARMWGNLKELLTYGKIAFEDDERLTGQLTTRRYSLTGKGKILLERKEDMKKRQLPSPDEADALALCFWDDELYFEPEDLITNGRKREATFTPCHEEMDLSIEEAGLRDRVA